MGRGRRGLEGRRGAGVNCSSVCASASLLCVSVPARPPAARRANPPRPTFFTPSPPPSSFVFPALITLSSLRVTASSHGLRLLSNSCSFLHHRVVCASSHRLCSSPSLLPPQPPPRAPTHLPPLPSPPLPTLLPSQPLILAFLLPCGGKNAGDRLVGRGGGGGGDWVGGGGDAEERS